MNTTEKGDKFEDESYRALKAAIESGDLPISQAHAKIFRKKGYFSKKRNKNIIFDISIEIWPKTASNFSIVYLIECKDHSADIEIGLVELFSSRIKDVAELNSKGIFISRSSFPETVQTYAANTGMMLMQIPLNSNYQVILHKRDRIRKNQIDLDNQWISSLIRSAFLPKRFQSKSVPKYSKNELEKVTTELTRQIGIAEPYYNSEHLNLLTEYLQQNLDANFNYTASLSDSEGRKLNGYFDPESATIFIDKSITETNRFSFVLAHEIGHLILHSDVVIDKSVYDNYADSRYDFLQDRHTLENPKQWLEWQANYFASALLLSAKTIELELFRAQTMFGIPRPGHIYLDNQPVNRRDFAKLLNYLSQKFNVTKTAIIYRLNELELITYGTKKDHSLDALRRIIANLDGQ